MSGSRNKRTELSSPPAKQATSKKFRPDLNESIIALQGMDLDIESQSLEDTVKDAISSSLPSMVEAPNSAVQTRNNKSAASSSSTDIDDIVARALKQLIPVIVSAVTSAVSAAVKATTKSALAEVLETSNTKVEQMQQMSLMMKYDIDKLEQYSRRESIRISGIGAQVGEKEEDIIEAVVQIAKDIDVIIQPNDISVAHRVGKANASGRSVLCRFVSRQVRDKVMKSRKKLKDLPNHKGKTYLNDDLTTMRARLMAYTKGLPNVQRVNTSNGKIHCNTKDGNHVIVDTPDDLFKLGVESIDYSKLGLQHAIYC